MDVHLQKKLFDKYPKLFIQKDLPITASCMAWGVDTGNGWYKLIDQACAGIVKADPKAQMLQVKEKMGTLRLYHSGNDAAQKASAKACQKSGKTCEACGKPGKMKGTNWFSVRCKTCKD